jgi:gamma-butyrobetaine dioxygenase
MGPTPLTPDFYAYPWTPLVGVDLRDNFATVAWADGTTLLCYSLWLAENTAGFGLEVSSRESTIDPADLPAPSDLVDASVGPRGQLVLTWAGGLFTEAHPGWLRHVADGRHLPASYLPPLCPWTSATFTVPPSLDGAQVLTDAAVLHEWLRLLACYGLARLRNTPTSADFLVELMDRIGPIRATNFGQTFDVRSVVDPDSTAYTGLNLGQHTDLPTRETPPGFQFLHCLANDVPGGWSRMTDGLAVVAELRDNYPADYDALTTLDWVFNNRSQTEDHRWVGPIIDNADLRHPLTLRAFYPVRGFPHMDSADVPRAYESMRRFSSVAHDPRFQIRYPFAPGDVVGFDNRRVLHGRDAFDPGGGARHLRGCYLDQDDVYSRVRVLTRRTEQMP